MSKTQTASGAAPWPKVRLGDVCEVKAGRDYKDVEAPDGKYPIYGTGGVMGMSREWRCPAGSVIVGRKGTLDNPMLIGEPFWNIDTCFGVIPSDKLIPAYLWRFCQNFDFYSLVPASGRPSTTSDAVKAIELPLPPLAEQKKIVEEVEKALKRVDALKAQFERMEKSAADYFKAALAETFSAVKGEKVKLGDVCETITDGDHQPPPKTDEGVPFLVISNVAGGTLDFTNTRHVPEGYYKAIDEKRKPKMGDVLLTVTGSFGIPVLVDSDRPFCFQRHIALLRTSKMPPEFLRYLMLAPESVQYFDRVATGAAQRTVSLSSLREMEVVLPKIDVQREVVKRLTEIKCTASRLEEAARRCIGICGKMRKAILAEAFQ